MSRSRDKQETDSVNLTTNHGFLEQNCAGMEDLSGGLCGRATGSPTA
jgi:hypothetical protein